MKELELLSTLIPNLRDFRSFSEIKIDPENILKSPQKPILHLYDAESLSSGQ